MSTDLNPYAPPQAAVADISEAPSEAEAIRREHIKHEASIRSVGILYYLSGGLMALIAAMFVAGLTDINFGIGLAVVYGALAALSIVVGHQIRALRPWARIAAIVLSVIGLFGFPLGTLINGYILYLLLSKKGQRIFASDYADIVAATPHVKYKTSIVLWIILGVLLLLILAAVLAPFLVGLMGA